MAEPERRVWIWLKRDTQGISRDSRTAIGRAAACGAGVAGVAALGAEESEQDWSGLAASLYALGADELILLRLPPESDTRLDAVPNALVWAVRRCLEGAETAAPTDLLAIADVFGRDLLARAACALRAPLLQDCVAVDFVRGTGEKYLLSGRARAVHTMPEGLRCWTFRQNAPPGPPAARSADGDRAGVRVLHVPALVSRLRLVPIGSDADVAEDEVARFWKEQPELAEASVVLAGGRSVGSREHFALLHAVAARLHASVGASRSAVDMGFAPPGVQIGQTGMVISPNLYMAFGISGSVFHLAGIRTARKVVAVDADPLAPIFTRADYGIEADLFEVLPLMHKLL
ncbi:MAG: electron transfer flavoprotein subunit alpha/FixB family protein [Deltaproteobacteria bacterium]|jgi:electron transfer flavoprotein alpha subunit|nr:electron transfer flavoprotein subunit alpha/FixB family protein [Deltaproteobacteria bacterium]